MHIKSSKTKITALFTVNIRALHPYFQTEVIDIMCFFIDDYSKITWICPLNGESEIKTTLINFKRQIKNSLNVKINKL